MLDELRVPANEHCRSRRFVRCRSRVRRQEHAALRRLLSLQCSHKHWCDEFLSALYPNGVVVATTSPGTLRDVTKWLNRQQKLNFHYSMRGNSVQFTEDRGGALSYVYSGTIGTDSLTLRIDGYDHKQSMGYVERTYKFAHVDFSP